MVPCPRKTRSLRSSASGSREVEHCGCLEQRVSGTIQPMLFYPEVHVTMSPLVPIDVAKPWPDLQGAVSEGAVALCPKLG
jgi:hypothetical protein